MRIFIRSSFSDTAIITEYRQIFKIAKYRIYEVKFLKKRAILLTDHYIKHKYKHLKRVTNYKFIGLKSKEELR